MLCSQTEFQQFDSKQQLQVCKMCKLHISESIHFLLLPSLPCCAPAPLGFHNILRTTCVDLGWLLWWLSGWMGEVSVRSVRLMAPLLSRQVLGGIEQVLHSHLGDSHAPQESGNTHVCVCVCVSNGCVIYIYNIYNIYIIYIYNYIHVQIARLCAYIYIYIGMSISNQFSILTGCTI